MVSFLMPYIVAVIAMVVVVMVFKEKIASKANKKKGSWDMVKSNLSAIRLPEEQRNESIDSEDTEPTIDAWSKWLPYKRKERLLNRSEVAMLEKLRLVFNKRQYEVMASVRMLDLVELDKDKYGAKTLQPALNKIGRMQVDFVVCEKTSTNILIAIELDSPFHDTGEARMRDAKKDIVMAAVGIPIRRFRVEERIRHGELREVLMGDPVVAALLNGNNED